MIENSNHFPNTYCYNSDITSNQTYEIKKVNVSSSESSSESEEEATRDAF
jgi:hypothetical protein